MLDRTTIFFNKDYLVAEAGCYLCSREQAKAILAKKKSKYKQDTPQAGDDAHCDARTYDVRRHASGGIQIGCMFFTKHEVAKVKRWLAGKQPSLGNPHSRTAYAG